MANGDSVPRLNGRSVYDTVIGILLAVIGFLTVNVFNDVKYLVRRESEQRTTVETVTREVVDLRVRMRELEREVNTLKARNGG